MKNQIISTYDDVELKKLIKDCIDDAVNELKLKLKKSNNSSIANNKQIFSRKETAELLKVSLPTLHSYTKNGLIKASKIGKSVRYKLEDISNALAIHE